MENMKSIEGNKLTIILQGNNAELTIATGKMIALLMGSPITFKVDGVELDYEANIGDVSKLEEMDKVLEGAGDNTLTTIEVNTTPISDNPPGYSNHPGHFGIPIESSNN